MGCAQGWSAELRLGELTKRLDMTGTVKWYDKEKGYGFITPDGGTSQSDDVFVHVGQVKRSLLENLTEGQVVSFDTFQGKKSIAAKNICVLAATPQSE